VVTIQLDDTVNFLVDLLNIHSPTGYYHEAIDFVEARLKALGTLDLWHTRKGALMGRLKGASDARPIGLTAHADTLGLMVREIKNDGRLKINKIGGMLLAGSENEGVTIRTFDNRRIRGTLVPVNTSTHVNAQIATTVRDENSMEIRLDARTTSKAETEALGIGVGDFVFVDPRVELTETGFIKSRFLDDKAGVACLYAALKALADAGLTPPQDVYIQIANYEEVGHGGATGFPPNLEELVSIDMGAIGEGQNSDEYSVSICVKDGGGPYHIDLTDKLRRLAAANDIPHRPDIYLYYASDGTSYWRAGHDARVALAGPGIAASHSYERTHRDSLLHSAHLLARYMLEPV
jgi:putative aminopeptidase FrvX